jgi:hypothetical protein
LYAPTVHPVHTAEVDAPGRLPKLPTPQLVQAAEVAAAVGVGLDAVYKRLSRLHAALRQCVEGKLIEAKGAHR